eukprot:g2189.t1
MQAEAGKIGPDGLYVTGLLCGRAPTYQSTSKALRSLVASSPGPLHAIQTLWRDAGVIVARGSTLSASQLMAYDQSKTKLKSSLPDGPILIHHKFCRQIYLQEDVDWHQSNSVRDMVRNHILPRTAGKGVGYALKINHQSPLEVEVLVSHSWNENAEELDFCKAANDSFVMAE